MGFEYQQTPGRRIKTVTYTDDLIDSIFKRKAELKVDVTKELNVLEEMEQELQAEYTEACKKRDEITDWDSEEYSQAEAICDDLWCKIDTLDDMIDSLEELSNTL